MLKNLGVSRSGYRAFLMHKPSASQQRKHDVKKRIKDIYDELKQNYGTPKIIAWTLSDNMEVSCVLNTINKAKERRNTELLLILHSDLGSQYVSRAYRKAIRQFQLSYSQTGYPYDNACIESFHSLTKREWLNRFTISGYNQAYRLVFEYIEAFYNTIRIHSHNNYMSPDEFENLYMHVSDEGIRKKAV